MYNDEECGSEIYSKKLGHFEEVSDTLVSLKRQDPARSKHVHGPS